MLPPFVGVAVNVTAVPEHIGFASADTLTLTGRLLLTVIFTRVELAGEFVAQVAMDVTTQLTATELTGV